MQIPKFSLWLCAFALCGGMTLRAEDTPAQAAARAALLEKMQQIEGNPAPAPQTPAPAANAPAPASVAPVKVVTPAPAVEAPAAAAPVPAAVVETPAPAVQAPVATETAPGVDTPAQAAARAALEQKMQEMGGAPAPQPSATPSAAKPVVSAPAKTTGERVITAPPLPINLSKEQKLDWLTQQYKADQITPEQYHEQRAAILAGH